MEPRHTQLRPIAIAAFAICATSSASAQDRSFADPMFRYGGADVADVSPTTGHVELNIPLVDVGGIKAAARYSGAHLWESTPPGDNSSYFEVSVNTAGTLSAVDSSGVFATSAVRSWRTMPLYTLRIVPATYTHLGTPGGASFSIMRVRYVLTTPDGNQHEFREFRSNGERWECPGYYHRIAFTSSRWRTFDGSQMELDHSNPRNATVTLPGGTTLHFPWETRDLPGDGCNGPALPNARITQSYESIASISIDRNGNATTFDNRYDAASRTGTVSVVASNGVEVRFSYVRHFQDRFDEKGNDLLAREPSYIRSRGQLDVTEIDFPGVGGARLKHRFIWGRRNFEELSLINPQLPGQPTERAHPRYRMLDLDYWVLERIELADGGRYQFTYHDLTREGRASQTSEDGFVVSDGRIYAIDYPAGGRTEFSYGGNPCDDPAAQLDPYYAFTCVRRLAMLPGTVRESFDARTCNENGCMDPTSSMFRYTGGIVMQRLDWRRISSRRDYASPSALARETTYARSVEFGSYDCRRGPDNPQATCGLFAFSATTENHTRTTKFYTYGSRRSGQVREITDYDNGVLLRKETNDEWRYEEMSSLNSPISANVRSTLKRVEEGALVTETRTEFDRTGGSICRDRAEGEGPGGCIPHTFTRGLVLARSTFQNGQLLKIERSEYEDRPEYVLRGLWNLVRRTTVEGPEGIARREDRMYDETPVADGQGAALVPVNGPRGNLTRIRTWFDANRYADETATYFANGDVESETNARGATTRYMNQLAPCAEPGATRTITAVNAIEQTVTSTLDCYTGLTLRALDENGKETFSRYDALGRVTKMWSSGDSEELPTKWFEYFPFATTGSVDTQRAVEHLRDGTADGIVSKTFFDGLGRVVQTRAELDPSTTLGGYGESSVTTKFDAFGRVVRAYEPCGDAVSDRVTQPCTTSFVATEYDALGRAVVVDVPGPSVARTRYEPSPDGMLMVSDDGVGGISRTLSNVLGARTRLETFWDAPEARDQRCTDGFCPTTFVTDAMGRVVRVTDVWGNETVLRYDWAGRLERREDPDLGTTTLTYDADGRERSRVDAKGQTTRRQYDLVGRLVIEDRPPMGPGVEDLRYFYDGQHATDCYSCDDHDEATADRCNAETFLCEHRLDGEEIWSARDTTFLADDSRSDEEPIVEASPEEEPAEEESFEESPCDPEFELCD